MMLDADASALNGLWRGTQSQLRPIAPADYEFLYQIATDSPNLFRWRFRGAVPERSEFVKTLWNGVLVQFVVEIRGTQIPAGLVTAYNANLRDGWAFVSTVSAPSLHHRGVGIEGMLMLLDHVFTGWPLRKVYVEAADYNSPQFASASKGLFTEEGRFRVHIFYDGKYWDFVTWAITRETWESAHVSPEPKLVTLRASQATLSEDNSLSIEQFGQLIEREFMLDRRAEPESRLSRDLRFDSLMILELIAMIDELAGGVDSDFPEEFDTIRDAYAWYCTVSSQPRTIRLSRQET